MPTAISADNFQAALGYVYDAILSGDYAAAWKYYAAAEAQHQGLEYAAGDGGASLTRRQGLAALKDALEAGEAAASRTGDKLAMIRCGTGFSQ
jgi:hypothetical protein